MVVFTCNNCGDSIQKPKVEKHISIECKKKFMNPSLCCIDCLKDFNRISYNEHTKCVTELERYSAKGYVPKTSSNKGEKKQQSWLEVIQAVLEKPDVSKHQRNLLESLSGLSNVPRKKQKFRNFIAKSLHHLKAPFALIDEVFDLIDNEFKSTKATNNDNTEPQKNDSIKPEPTKPVEEQNSIAVQSDGETKKKKKKNKTQSENKDIAVESQNDDTKAAEGLDESGAFEIVKKKKKSKKKENTNNENQSTEIEKNKITENVMQNGKRPLEDDFEEEIPAKSVSKKKQKKLKLQEFPVDCATDSSAAIDSQNSTIPELELNGSAEITSVNGKETLENLSKKKKKQNKKQEPQQLESQITEPNVNGTAAEVPVVENTDRNSEKLSKKEKKKKQKSQGLQETDIPTETRTELNDTVSETPAAENLSADIPMDSENYEKLSKKEKKELKKRLKYEAQLKAIQIEAKSENNEFANNDQENTDTNQKPEKKKKRKLADSNENEEVSNKKSKITEAEPALEEIKPIENSKFSWEDVIRTVLEKAADNELSLKKLSKKVVDEYMSYHPNQKSHDDIVKKFNKKIVKLPFVVVFKDKAKLRPQ